MLFADPMNGGQLCKGIECAEFRGLGEIDHTGHDGVLPVGVAVVRVHGVGDGLCGEFAQRMGQGQHLMAAEFNGTGFVGADMASFSAKHALI